MAKTNWTAKRLDEVAEVVGRGITPKYADNGDFVVLNQRCVRNGRIDFALARRHDSNQRKVKEEKQLQLGDVVVNSTGVGTLGRTAPVTSLSETTTADSHLTILRPLPGIEPGWLRYAVSDAEHEIEAMAEGSTGQTELSRHRLAGLTLLLPPYSIQKEIAYVLGSLDDKIESNQRLATIIPSLISALIEERLVRDKNRESASVSSLARFVNGGAFTKGASGSGRMVIRIAELNSGPSGTTVYNDIAVPEDKVARAGDILMSWSGSLDVYRWTRNEAIINQHIFKVIPKGLPDWYVYDRLKAVIGIFQGIAKDKATTMGHIKRGDLDTTLVPVLAQSEVEKLDRVCRPLWDKLLLADAEVHRLAALRDTLLPELLSGRITPEQLEAGL